jgi:hypothetical protein
VFDHSKKQSRSARSTSEAPGVPGKTTLVQRAYARGEYAPSAATSGGGDGGAAASEHGAASSAGALPAGEPIERLFGRVAGQGAGEPLPAQMKGKFEPSLGVDLSAVRVHTGSASAESAAAVGAKAYTVGQDLHFATGQYDPDSGAGQHLLAHEVAHTVQQRGATPVRQNRLEVSTPQDAAEHEADRAADAMMRGEPAAITVSTSAHVARQPAPGAQDSLDGGLPPAGAPPQQPMPADTGPTTPGGQQAPAPGQQPPATGQQPPANGQQPPANATTGGEWVSNPPAPDPSGEQKFSQTSVTKQQLLDAITNVAPGMSQDFRIMLVGHSWVEQRGQNVINNNFAGMEGHSNSFVTARTSAIISKAQYDANPKAYSDFGPGKQLNGKDASTIKVQLDRGETTLAVMTRTQRPAYASLDSAATAFIHNIEAKFQKLQASDDPDHKVLAQQALAGDEEAYAKVVTLSASKLGILPYNPSKDYPGRVIKEIRAARSDLAKAPAPAAGASP